MGEYRGSTICSCRWEIRGNAEKRDWGEAGAQAGGHKPLSERIHSYVAAKGRER